MSSEIYGNNGEYTYGTNDHKFLSQLRNKGISQADLDALILNEQDIAKKAYDYNGVANPVSPNFRALMQNKGISQAELDALILNDQDIAAKAYDHNGVANPASPNFRALVQRQSVPACDSTGCKKGSVIDSYDVPSLNPDLRLGTEFQYGAKLAQR